MKIYIKIRFNSGRDHIESFGEGRYLVYMKANENDSNVMPSFKKMLSKFLGVPSESIKGTGKKLGEAYIFEIL